MGDLAIRVENLSKLYHIGEHPTGVYRYKALRDVLTNTLVSPFRRGLTVNGYQTDKRMETGNHHLLPVRRHPMPYAPGPVPWGSVVLCSEACPKLAEGCLGKMGVWQKKGKGCKTLE